MNKAIIPIRNRAWWWYKIRALLISFSVSVLLISLLTVVLLNWLYPEWFLFRYDGGWQGLKIVMGVDLVLGPVIAFIIFSPNKARRLILLDIAIVGTIQLSAFIWGCYALWSQHPLALSYRDGTFNSITIADLRTQNVSTDVLAPFSGTKPILIYSQPPSDEKTSVAEVIEMFTMTLSPYARIESYRPIKDHLKDIFGDQAIQTIRKQALEKESPNALATLAKKHKKDIDALYVVPITMRTHNAMMVVDENANIVGGIPTSDNFESVMAIVKKQNKR